MKEYGELTGKTKKKLDALTKRGLREFQHANLPERTIATAIMREAKIVASWLDSRRIRGLELEEGYGFLVRRYWAESPAEFQRYIKGKRLE